MSTHWLLVSSPENFEVSRARGFDIAGMKSRHRKKAETVAAGDTVLFYLVGLKAVGEKRLEDACDWLRVCQKTGSASRPSYKRADSILKNWEKRRFGVRGGRDIP